jgi:hypothetical protein
MNLEAKNPLDLGLSKTTTMKPSDRLPFDATAKERAVLGIPQPNVLGNLAGARPVPAGLRPPIEAIARRYAEKLLDRKTVDDLRALLAEIETTQRLMEEHSPVLFDQKIRDLSDAYARDPSEKNMRALRHAKSLDAGDHARVQEHQVIRQKGLLAKLTPLVHPLFKQAVELLQSDIDALATREAAEADAWQTAPAPSPLLAGLRAVLADFRIIAHHEAPRFQNPPPLVMALLKIDREKTAGQ